MPRLPPYPTQQAVIAKVSIRKIPLSRQGNFLDDYLMHMLAFEQTFADDKYPAPRGRQGGLFRQAEGQMRWPNHSSYILLDRPT